MKARKEIRKSNRKKIIFQSNSDELNRKILEKEKIDVLLLNQSGRTDKTKQRNSGFNHVLAKIAKKKNSAIGINFDEIIESGEKRKADILGRVMQNVKLCNKNKLKMKFVSLKNKNKINIYDVKSLGLVLGMPTWMTKNLDI
jgi:ribonuclease P/MRP protein subunit RPP1